MYRKLGLLLGIVVASIFQIEGQSKPPFPFKSGMIQYHFEGRTKGTEILYFDEYGNLFSDSKTITGRKYPDVVLLKHGITTVLDQMHRTATVQEHFRQTVIAKKLITKGMLSAMGFKKKGEEKVANISCDKYAGENGTLWVWNSLILKSKMEVMGIKINTEATKILTGINISSATFDIPEGYKIVTE